MAARRGKSQARRTGGSGGTPGWVWLVAGIALTLAVVLLAPRLFKGGGGDGFFRPRPNPDALPAPVSSGDSIAPDTVPAGEPAKATSDKPRPTQYDFYTLLPGQEVAMSDAELAASAKAEAAAQARAAQQAAQAAGATEGTTLPQPVAEAASAPAAAASDAAVPAPATPAPATAAPASSGSQPAAAVARAEPAASGAHYILQAGAFGASGDAEATKARIALLGLNARVEAAQINGKTVYRVRMGPYGSASELAEAKAKLAGGGLPAMAVKTQ